MDNTTTTRAHQTTLCGRAEKSPPFLTSHFETENVKFPTPKFPYTNQKDRSRCPHNKLGTNARNACWEGAQGHNLKTLSDTFLNGAISQKKGARASAPVQVATKMVKVKVTISVYTHESHDLYSHSSVPGIDTCRRRVSSLGEIGPRVPCSCFCSTNEVLSHASH